jgi:hypothetical protein
MPTSDRARDMAACLGLDETLIRRLQARGYLLNFDLSEAEIRERLYRAHRRYQLRRSAKARHTRTNRSPTPDRRPLTHPNGHKREQPRKRGGFPARDRPAFPPALSRAGG